jgi:hypothetical protein
MKNHDELVGKRLAVLGEKIAEYDRMYPDSPLPDYLMAESTEILHGLLGEMPLSYLVGLCSIAAEHYQECENCRPFDDRASWGNLSKLLDLVATSANAVENGGKMEGFVEHSRPATPDDKLKAKARWN